MTANRTLLDFRSAEPKNCGSVRIADDTGGMSKLGNP
jgi:hypothetical protein